MAERPDLVHPERGKDEMSVAEGSRELPLPKGQGGVAVGVARSVEAPTSYIGDASGATAVRGRALLDFAITRLVTAIRAVKADKESPEVQKRFEAQRLKPR